MTLISALFCHHRLCLLLFCNPYLSSILLLHNSKWTRKDEKNWRERCCWGKCRRRSTLYVSFNYSFTMRWMCRRMRCLHRKFNLILNTSNDKFIYDDSKRHHRWMEDWKEGKFLVSNFFFFRGCFAPLLLDAHVKILLMYSWRPLMA